MERAKDFLRSIFGRDEAGISRRDALAGLGLAGLLLATPKLLGSSPAEAKPLDKPASVGSETKATQAPTEEGAVDLNANDTADVTELSSRHRYWHRRRRYYWRRRYRRRYWRRRYW